MSIVIALALAFIQVPGLTVADTKFDLAENPIGFLKRAAHLWSGQAPMGQVQNQAYGYFFPHGAFFAVGQLIGMPGWITQRIWWALVLLAGFWGIVRLAAVLGVGSNSSRVVAGVAFALCPRVITTLGSISSETLPMMLVPWVMVAPVAFARYGRMSVSGCARSAVAVALMGAVNAVATVAATIPALLWFATVKPNRAWIRFAAFWIPALLAATLWWVVPLLLLGRFSPPFLDYIESSAVTTEWMSLGEVLRGTDSWTPFVSPERIAGAVLVTQPACVLATGVPAAAGMAGLAMRSMPSRGRLTLILCVGLVGMSAGFLAEMGSPLADHVRVFLDSAGAPLRNVHKLEPLVRVPLTLGLAHLLRRVPFAQWRTAFAHPERDRAIAVAGLVLAALTVATALAWTGRLAPRGAYAGVPAYWRDTAGWLARSAPDTRALVVPGAPFAAQVWGLTRDEPLQGFATTPWAVRDAVPLTPPGAIRALDSVQRLIADGVSSTGLADTLAGQGIGIVVVRNDLDPETSRSTRPLLVHQAIAHSPGLVEVAHFGPPIRTPRAKGLVLDDDLRPDYPAVEIFRNTHAAASSGSTQYVHEVVQAGPEFVERLERDGPSGPVVLAADARRAGVGVDSVVMTDTPTDRETDFGKVDNHSSAIRAAGDARRTRNLVPDYPVAGAPLVRAEWSGARVSVSSSAADATQLGGTSPGSNAAAAVDGDPTTSWISGGIDNAVGQWLRLDLDHPVTTGLLRVTTSPAAVGPAVRWIEVATAAGSTAARIDAPGHPVTVSLPPGRTSWLRITATHTENDTAGIQFGISELSLADYSTGIGKPVPIARRVVVGPPPAGAVVRDWDLGQELPGRSGCFDAPDRVRCANGLALPAEEPGWFERTLTVLQDTEIRPELTVRARSSPELAALLTEPNHPVARGQADVGDLRGAAFAATDGDPRTSWIAPAATITSPAGGKPTLTIELPEPAVVAGLVITASAGQLPAHPTSVSVNLGDGPQVRDIGDKGRIALHPHRTRSIELSLQTWDGVFDRTALGFVTSQPPGIADVTVLGSDRYPPPDPGRRVVVDCAHGPVITIAGRQVPTTLTATAAQLISGDPVSATPCGPTPRLTAGRMDVAVAPTSLFTVDRLRLITPAHPRTSIPLVTLPVSANAGWQATSADGRILHPIVVDGWRQGWLLPTDFHGPVTFSFPADRWYQAAVFGGLVLLIPLFGLASRRSRVMAFDVPETYRNTVAAALGTVALGFVIAGGVGVACVGVAALATVLPAVRRFTPVIAGVGTAVAVAALSTGPWRSSAGYLGGSAAVQLPALIAVLTLACAQVPRRRRNSLPPTGL